MPDRLPAYEQRNTENTAYNSEVSNNVITQTPRVQLQSTAYDISTNTIKDKSLDIINRLDPDNPYSGKGFWINWGKMTDQNPPLGLVGLGYGGYVTKQGVWKPYSGPGIGGSNDCPVVSDYIANEPSDRYKYVKTLIKGTPIVSGQTCGNEGGNVFTSKLIANPTKNFVGCYNDKYNPLNKNNLGLAVPTDGSESLINKIKTKTVFGTQMVDDCTKYAAENNFQYFAMQQNSDNSYKCTAFNSSNTNDYDRYNDAMLNTKIVPFTVMSSSSNGNESENGIVLKLLNTGQIQLYDTGSFSVKVTVPSNPQDMCINSGNISMVSSNFSCKPIEGFINMINSYLTPKKSVSLEGFSNQQVIPSSDIPWFEPRAGTSVEKLTSDTNNALFKSSGSLQNIKNYRQKINDIYTSTKPNGPLLQYKTDADTAVSRAETTFGHSRSFGENALKTSHPLNNRDQYAQVSVWGAETTINIENITKQILDEITRAAQQISILVAKGYTPDANLDFWRQTWYDAEKSKTIGETTRANITANMKKIDEIYRTTKPNDSLLKYTTDSTNLLNSSLNDYNSIRNFVDKSQAEGNDALRVDYIILAKEALEKYLNKDSQIKQLLENITNDAAGIVKAVAEQERARALEMARLAEVARLQAVEKARAEAAAVAAAAAAAQEKARAEAEARARADAEARAAAEAARIAKIKADAEAAAAAKAAAEAAAKAAAERAAAEKAAAVAKSAEIAAKKAIAKLRSICDNKLQCSIDLNDSFFEINSEERFCDPNTSDRYLSYSYKCGPTAQTSSVLNNSTTASTTISCSKYIDTNCTFFLFLNEDNGKIELYKGNPTTKLNNPSSYADSSPWPFGNPIWQSNNTKPETIIPNNNWMSELGKSGNNFLSQKNALTNNEWIGSKNGNFRIIMINGNLQLQILSFQPGCDSNTKMPIGPDVDAIYKINEYNKNNMSNFNKLAYIDSDSQLQEYDATAIEKSKTYSSYKNYDIDASNNTINAHSTYDSSSCQSLCDSQLNCDAYVHDSKVSGSNNCFLKQGSSTSIFQNKTFSNETDKSQKTLYIRNPQIKPNILSKCNKNILDIDTIKYAKYNKINGSINSSSKIDCNMVDELIPPYKQVEYISSTVNNTSELINNNIGSIIGKKEDDISLNANIFQMDINQTRMNSDVPEYQNNVQNVSKLSGFKNLYSNNSYKEGMTTLSQNLTLNDVKAMLSDSDTRILQANYSYILWSVLAVGLLSVTVNTVNK